MGAATWCLRWLHPPPPCPANWDSSGASGSTQLPFLPESGLAIPKARLGRPSSLQSPRPAQPAFRVTLRLQWHASLLHVLEAGVCSQGWPCPSLPSAALLGVPSRGTCCQDQKCPPITLNRYEGFLKVKLSVSVGQPPLRNTRSSSP